MPHQDGRVVLYIPAEGRIVVQGLGTTPPSVGELLTCRERQYRVAGVHAVNHTLVLTIETC